MDIPNIVGPVQQLLATNPLMACAVSAAVGAGLWHRALTYLETDGVDAAVNWAAARQKRAAKALGFTDAQIAAIEGEEAIAAQRAADDAKAKAAADLAAIKPAEAPKA